MTSCREVRITFFHVVHTKINVQLCNELTLTHQYYPYTPNVTFQRNYDSLRNFSQFAISEMFTVVYVLRNMYKYETNLHIIKTKKT